MPRKRGPQRVYIQKGEHRVLTEKEAALVLAEFAQWMGNMRPSEAIERDRKASGREPTLIEHYQARSRFNRTRPNEAAR